eukprot:COSAG01_NODE_838_length_13194_cov_9.063240_4_plen_196_part_00
MRAQESVTGVPVRARTAVQLRSGSAWKDSWMRFGTRQAADSWSFSVTVYSCLLQILAFYVASSSHYSCTCTSTSTGRIRETFFSSHHGLGGPGSQLSAALPFLQRGRRGRGRPVCVNRWEMMVCCATALTVRDRPNAGSWLHGCGWSRPAVQSLAACCLELAVWSQTVCFEYFARKHEFFKAASAAHPPRAYSDF